MVAAARRAAASALLGAAAGPAGAWTAAAPGDVEPHVPTELPRPGWPGPSAAESQGLWPSGRQPERHGAWPQRGAGAGQRTLLPCWKTSVLADHGQGWPGVCLELFQAKEVSDEQMCRELCLSEPRCPVWQFENETSAGQCWAGYGKSCVGRGGRPGTIAVQGAQRVMHGEVRVLQNMSGWKIQGLFQLGELTPERGAGEEGSAERCRRWCYSDIGCQYWQYGPGGCWVDSPLFSMQHGARAGGVVQYPLTTDGGAASTGYEAEHMRWGEYIQHYCPPQPGEVSSVAELLPETPRPSGAGQPGASAGWRLLGGSRAVPPPGGAWWAWALPGLVFLSLAGCACGLLWAAACGNRGARTKGPPQARKGARRSSREQPAGLFAARRPVPIGEEPWLQRTWPSQRRARGDPDGAGAAADAPDPGDGRSPRGGGAQQRLPADRASLLRPPPFAAFEAAAADADVGPSAPAGSAGRAAGPHGAVPPSLAPPGPGFGPPPPGFGPPPPGPPRAFAAGPSGLASGAPGQVVLGPRPPAVQSPVLSPRAVVSPAMGSRAVLSPVLSPRLIQPPFQPLGLAAVCESHPSAAASVRLGAAPQPSFARAPGVASAFSRGAATEGPRLMYA